ncbi:MAG: type II secretion system F family protein [Clostridia bacterium]
MKGKVLAEFFTNLSFLIETGMNDLKSVELLENSIKNKKTKKLVSLIKKELQEGVELYECFKKYRKYFDKDYFVYIKAGKESGNLPEVLRDLAKGLNENSSIKAQLYTSMIYPMTLIVATFVATIFIFTQILPQTVTQLQSISNGELPMITTVLLNISNFILDNVLFLITFAVFVIISVGVFVAFNRTLIDGIILKIYIIGQIYKNIDNSYIFTNLSNLIKAGIPMSQALEICYSGISNRYIKREFYKQILVKANQGEDFADIMLKCSFVSELDSICIYTAGKTGKLSEVLGRISKKLEDETRLTIKAFAGILEPLSMLILGTVIGAIALGVYMPMLTVGI